jgi:hypothetical protein
LIVPDGWNDKEAGVSSWLDDVFSAQS